MGAHENDCIKANKPGIAAPYPKEYVLVSVESLHEHEAINPDNLLLRERDIAEYGSVVPIVADREYLVILNGHHRFNALKKLGCKRVPVYLVDYFSTSVTLDLWPASSVCKLSKRDVIKMGLGRGVFPAKTTRHRFKTKFSRERVPLDELM
ncbi:MAG: ParB N-terminal domain-containing protein [Methanobacteriota archaeon]